MTWQAHVGLICAGGLMLAGAATVVRSSPAHGADAAPAGSSHYILRSAAEGTYVYRAPGWSASIASDGSVSFHEPQWVPRSHTVDMITGHNEGRRPEVWPVPLPDVNRPTLYDLRDDKGAQDPMTPRIPVAEPIFLDVGFKSDLTDGYTRLLGGDPYAASKGSFLADTFDFRMKLAAKQHRQAARVALADLSRELTAIWNDGRFSPAERGRIIYLWWQETASNDPDGARARQVIRDFARRNLPPEEAARFTAPGVQE